MKTRFLRGRGLVQLVFRSILKGFVETSKCLKGRRSIQLVPGLVSKRGFWNKKKKSFFDFLKNRFQTTQSRSFQQIFE